MRWEVRRSFLLKLKAGGLGSLPGTAAEVLDESVRAMLCPDKLSVNEWLEVDAPPPHPHPPSLLLLPPLLLPPCLPGHPSKARERMA